MAITIKGIFRGLKIIAQLFMQREHEIEIGYPTDVRHVSHIGLGAGDSCPSWMNEFRGTEAAAAAAAAGVGGAASISSAAQSRQTSWASLDFERPVGGSLPPADASAADYISAAPAHEAASRGGGAPKKPVKRSRASSPAGSSSWRSTASFAAGDLHPASLRVA